MENFIKLHSSKGEEIININHIIVIEPFEGTTLHSKIWFNGLFNETKSIAFKETLDEIMAKIKEIK